MIIESVNIAFKMIVGFDFKLIEILLLSIKINLISLFFSCLIGLPLGTILALNKFRFKSLILGILISLMGIPPVVVGLIVGVFVGAAVGAVVGATFSAVVCAVVGVVVWHGPVLH